MILDSYKKLNQSLSKTQCKKTLDCSGNVQGQQTVDNVKGWSIVETS